MKDYDLNNLTLSIDRLRTIRSNINLVYVFQRLSRQLFAIDLSTTAGNDGCNSD